MFLLNFPMASKLSDNSYFSELAKENSNRYEAKNHKKNIVGQPAQARGF